VAIRLQGVALPGIGQVPVQAIQALPYLLTVVLLAGFIGRSVAPQGAGHAVHQGALMVIPARPLPRACRARSVAAGAVDAMGPRLRAVFALPGRRRVLDEQGRIHAGCNVENAAYPQGCLRRGRCAQRDGAGRRAHGAAVLVVGPGRPVTPCGGCRQKMREFGGDSLPVLVADPSGLRARFTLGELLPPASAPTT
jgi:cytidine deaminase